MVCSGATCHYRTYYIPSNRFVVAALVYTSLKKGYNTRHTYAFFFYFELLKFFSNKEVIEI